MLQRHATGKGHLELGEIQLAEILVVAQGGEQGVEADEAVEAPLPQFLDQRRQVARIGDQDVVVALDQHGHAVNGEGIDVIERQRRDHHLGAAAQVFGHQHLALQHVGHQIAVGQHGALGDASGAAGVLQHGDVLGRRVGVDEIDVLALGHGIDEADGMGNAIGRHHLLDVADHGVDQQALEGRQQVADLGDDDVPDVGLRQHLFGQLRHVGQADQRPGAGILELVLHLAGGVQRVGVDHHQAGTHGAKDHHRILQHIGHLHGDAIAGLQVGMLLQVGGELTGQLIEFAVAQGAAQVAERRALGVGLAGLAEYRQDVAITVQVYVCLDALGIFVTPEIRHHAARSRSMVIVRWRAVISAEPALRA